MCYHEKICKFSWRSGTCLSVMCVLSSLCPLHFKTSVSILKQSFLRVLFSLFCISIDQNFLSLSYYPWLINILTVNNMISWDLVYPFMMKSERSFFGVNLSPTLWFFLHINSSINKYSSYLSWILTCQLKLIERTFWTIALEYAACLC